MDMRIGDVPERVDTLRLLLRCPRPGDGVALQQAVTASLAELRPWMPWARHAPTAAEAEATVQRMRERFLAREDLVYLIFERSTAGGAGEGRLVGGTGLHRIEWGVPKFEIGYWRRTGLGGQGLATEAVTALARVAFDRLRAQRVEIRLDARNPASRRVAERAGFTFEGLMRRDAIGADGRVRDTSVYSRVRGIEEP
jgi:RimJ/RimL family protein N-acetyltransferase